MNFLKRAMMAVSRKMGKTLILMVIFFVIANLVLTGFAIDHATKVASDNARKKIGGTITVSFNRQNAFQQAAKDGPEAMSKVKYEPVTDKMFDSISNIPGISYANKTVTGYALAKNFDPVQPQGTDSNSEQAIIDKAKKDAEKYNKNSKEYQQKMEDYQSALEKYKDELDKQQNQQKQDEIIGQEKPNVRIEGKFGGGNFKFRMPRMSGAPDMFQIGDASKMPDVTITGVSSSNVYDTFKNGQATMLEGNPIVPEDNGKLNAIIDTNLAKLNKLKVGSKITVKSVSGTKTYTLNVVGIYQNADAQTTGDGMAIRSMPSEQPYNNIFTDVDTANLLKSVDGKKSTGMDIAVFTAQDPKDIDSIVEAAKKLDIDWDKYSLDANQAAYKQMVGPIENVASFASLLIYLVAIAGALIICLIMMLSIKERMFETGVLMAMGEGRFKIIMQYISEVFVIAVIAFTLSFFSGQIIAQKTGDALLTKEIQVIEEQQQEIQNGKGGFFGAASKGMFQGINSQSFEQVEEIDVNISSNEMARTFGVGFLIILLGTLLPAINVMRFKPKTILTKA